MRDLVLYWILLPLVCAIALAVFFRYLDGIPGEHSYAFIENHRIARDNPGDEYCYEVKLKNHHINGWYCLSYWGKGEQK